MNNKELIVNLQKMFDKDQTKKKSEKEMTKNLDSIKSVIKGYYSKSEDIETALGKVAEVFKIVSRKEMSGIKDTSPEEYNKALQAMYFSEDRFNKLKELLPDFKDYFDDVKRKSIKDCGSKPVNYASTIKKIDKILNVLMSFSSLSLENTDLPALVCYLLKLKKRIEKYNGMVEKSNSDKKTERDTGAEPLPKSSINKKREREKIDQDLEEELTSSNKSQNEKSAPAEDNPQQNRLYSLNDSKLAQESKRILSEIDHVKDLEGYTEELKDLAKNAIDIHNATQDAQNLTSAGKIVRNFWGKFKTSTGVDMASLDGISTNLNTIAEDIKKLNENSKIEDVRPISNNVAKTLKNLGTYSTDKIERQGYLTNERINFVAAATAYLQRLQVVVSDYDDKAITATKDEISKEINEVEDEPTEAYECADNLEKLANIALKIRKKTQSLESANKSNSTTPGSALECLNTMFIKFKDAAQEAKNIAGYDLNSLKGISTGLQKIASNIRCASYASFKNDVAYVRGLIDGYNQSKISSKNDELKSIRENFIDKTNSCLDVIENALNDRTPEGHLEAIVDKFSAEINGIVVEPDKMPSVYAKQLTQLANIAPEIRAKTQELKKNSAIQNSVTDSAIKVLNFLDLLNKDNLFIISDELMTIAKKIPDCKLDEIIKAEKSIRDYQSKKSGIKDGLTEIRKCFTDKALKCLAEVKKLTQSFAKLKSNGKQNNGEQNEEDIKGVIKNFLLATTNKIALQFCNDIGNKFTNGEELSSEDFINSILPPFGTMKQIASTSIDYFVSKSKESKSVLNWLRHVGNISELVINKFVKGFLDKIRGNIEDCFEKINNRNKNGYPAKKCRTALDKIGDTGFKEAIEEILNMGESYSSDLEELKKCLGTVISDFYGCNIDGEKVSVPSVGDDPSKLINIFSYQELFSNAVSLYNYFNDISNYIEEYPKECLKKEIEKRKKQIGNKEAELENNQAYWEAKKKYYELYDTICSYMKLLKDEGLKSKGNLNLDINREVFRGNAPKTDKELAEGISNYLKEMGIAIGTVKGWISSSEVVTMKAKDDEGNEIDRKHIYDVLIACESAMKGKGFNNFNQIDYDKAFEKNNIFKENNDYLEIKGLKKESNNG